MTLFAAQTDFSEPGELTALHRRQPSLVPREHDVGTAAISTARRWSGAFQLLRLERPDLVAHDPRLSDGRAHADDRPDGLECRRHANALPHAFGISARDFFSATISHRAAISSTAVRSRCRISALPIFAVGTERDHVAPWQSVYKIHYLSDADDHLCPDERRSQRWYRQRARPSASAFSHRNQGADRPLPQRRRMARRGAPAGEFVVAGLDRVAGRAFRAGRKRRPPWGSGERLCTACRRSRHLCAAVMNRVEPDAPLVNRTFDELSIGETASLSASRQP